jgi:hypothetical protein
VSLIFRILWQVWPNLGTCALFWAVALFVHFRWPPKGVGIGWRTFSVIAVPGILCNAAVTLANQGRMPVIGDASLISVWVKAGDNGHTHLLFLCDRYNLGGVAIASVGDFFIFAGAFAGLAVFLINKARVYRLRQTFKRANLEVEVNR